MYRGIPEDENLFNIAAFGLDAERASRDLEYLQQHIDTVMKGKTIKITRPVTLSPWR